MITQLYYSHQHRICGIGTRSVVSKRQNSGWSVVKVFPQGMGSGIVPQIFGTKLNRVSPEVSPEVLEKLCPNDNFCRWDQPV